MIVTWNSVDWVDGCLGSVRRFERSAAEVVVVDNGSGDGTVERLRSRFPEARLIECGSNTGYCHANNLGIAATKSPFVLLLNPDTRLDPRFIEELLGAFDDASVGIAGGKLLRFDGRTLDSAGQRLGRSRQPIDRGYATPDDGRFDFDEEVFGICGAAMLCRREMLDELVERTGAVFDESFFAFYEDLDLAWRARRLGWKACYRYRAVGHHARSGTAFAGPGRWRALANRGEEARYHVVKNRYLAILRNDSLKAYARDFPFIWARDLATLAFLLVASPGVLRKLWRERDVFRRALASRRPRSDA